MVLAVVVSLTLIDVVVVVVTGGIFELRGAILVVSRLSSACRVLARGGERDVFIGFLFDGLTSGSIPLADVCSVSIFVFFATLLSALLAS